jgi:hypothetical protein
MMKRKREVVSDKMMWTSLGLCCGWTNAYCGVQYFILLRVGILNHSNITHLFSSFLFFYGK